MSRHFTTDYQFSTDSYRMFSALSKLNRTPSSWYSAGPTQKYMLRQIKAMDYTLLSNEHRSQITEKASYSQLDSDGKPMINEDLDISLLMLYGHILAAGASYSFALSEPGLRYSTSLLRLILYRLLFSSPCSRPTEFYDMLEYRSCLRSSCP